MAKAAPWTKTDAQVRKRGEQTGLDTPVVHAVNDVDLGCALEAWLPELSVKSTAREYGRKVKTQMN